MFSTVNKFEFQGKIYEAPHGGPFDRGAADSYYGRRRVPHKGGVGGSAGPRIDAGDLTEAEKAEYFAGYDWNEAQGLKKDW